LIILAKEQNKMRKKIKEDEKEGPALIELGDKIVCRKGFSEHVETGTGRDAQRGSEKEFFSSTEASFYRTAASAGAGTSRGGGWTRSSGGCAGSAFNGGGAVLSGDILAEFVVGKVHGRVVVEGSTVVDKVCRGCGKAAFARKRLCGSCGCRGRGRCRWGSETTIKVEMVLKGVVELVWLVRRGTDWSYRRESVGLRLSSDRREICWGSDGKRRNVERKRRSHVHWIVDVERR
jgi:hypothetical protein